MKRLLVLVAVVGALFLIGCNSDDPIANPPKGDQDTADTSADDDIIVDTGNSGDTVDTGDTGDTSDSGNSGDTGNDNIGKPCKVDGDCGKAGICVNAKCAQGCTSDDECKLYGPTVRCNTLLGRCLNLAATNQACSERKCPKGCCYTDEGFTEMKCAASPTTGTCGMCEQGKIFRGGNECVPVVCSRKSGEDKCPTYNKGAENSECFECQSSLLICHEDPNCGGSGSGVVVNVESCIPAGQACTADSECCSGQPCISGYCF